MDLRELIKNQGLDEMAARFRDKNLAEILLAEIGFPLEQRPPFPNNGNILEYWRNVCTRIDDGVIVGSNDLQPLIDAAYARFPGNPVFERYRTQPGAEDVAGIELQDNSSEAEGTTQSTAIQRPSQDLFINILIEGWDGVQDLINRARTLAEQLGMPPETVQLGLANAEGILLNLAEPWTTEQAARLAQQLEALPEATQQGVRTNVASTAYQDYLISSLFVEGLDQAKFEINDIRASTHLRDIAEGVIGTQYSQEIGVQGEDIQGREVVVDRLHSDGSTERLNPDQSLHVQNIQEDETLIVSPESTAGCFPGSTRVTLSNLQTKPISQIIVGDSLLSLNIESNKPKTTFVSEIYQGISEYYLIINKKLKVTDSHLVYANSKWTHVRDLKLGDSLKDQNGCNVPVTSIESKVENIEVFNIHLESVDHNFYAESLLVHNMDRKLMPLPSMALQDPLRKFQIQQYKSPVESLELKDRLNSSKAIYNLTFQENEIDIFTLNRILVILRDLSGDESLTLRNIRRGSIILTLEGSFEGFKILQKLLDSGLLTDVLGLNIVHIGLDLQNSQASMLVESGEEQLKVSLEKRKKLRVFLCYESLDVSSIRELYRILCEEGFHPWLDEIEIVPGQAKDKEISKAVNAANAAIICLSKNFVTRQGIHHSTLKLALDKADNLPDDSIFMIPLRFEEEVEIPECICKLEPLNYFGDLRVAYKRLILALDTCIEQIRT